ncbi:MAG: methylated-DNA--[protein]-cysteine S-methyltransferase, partial [Gammaproteobacteria bacterium]|nr:methylated-DNA--[protein]-cysteine S-methyltransferase [Gammaproteobacteria bacterium]
RDDYQAIMTSPIGRIGIKLNDQEQLVALDFLGERGRSKPGQTYAARRIVAALMGYFTNPSLPLHLPLATTGTPFQQKVWRALQDIPAGTTRTYGELAQQIASAPRAVGQACRRNPLPIVVPCHRVVGQTGVGGYSGATSGPDLAIKSWLLTHEGVKRMP